MLTRVAGPVDPPSRENDSDCRNGRGNQEDRGEASSARRRAAALINPLSWGWA